MRRHLGALALASALLAPGGLLAACGESDDAPAEAPATSDTGTGGTDGTAGSPEVELLRASDAGGAVTEEAVEVGDEAALAGFLEPLDPAFGAEVRARVETLAEQDGRVLASVVAVGCASPTSARLSGDDIEVDLPKSDEQCRVPVTTVALAVP
ncbi:hypothetical protein [Nocardioides abyssi]|uniref:Lipoprotein n=1 Tax=Nocardioides abyssi TaxID=3058370 RepID=A0ABT8EPH5_9ACTN|nr:hypothetical protein [Nocardioides abyssi]MDN4160029.1 hypothetical protein [Nocardioides abyssi]